MSAAKVFRNASCPRYFTYVFLVMLGAAVLSFVWYSQHRPPLSILICPQNNEDKISHQSHLGKSKDNLKDLNIIGLLYEEPKLINPRKTDVLTVTPWLAPIIWDGVFNRDILNAQFHQMDVRIGLTVFAIKKYVRFIPNFIKSAEKFFMVGHKVNYYIFTDRAKDISNFTLAEGRSVVTLDVPAYKRWQDVSMRRMEMLRDYAINRFSTEVDYLVCIDADMIFLDEVGVEILGDVVGSIHNGFFGSTRDQFPNERRPQSAGYIPIEAGDFYYSGAHFGGNIEEIIRMTNFCHHAMLEDKQKNMEARWHDESYLNKYLLFHKPTKLLSPEYIWHDYFARSKFVQKIRINTIQKDNNEIRSRRAISIP